MLLLYHDSCVLAILRVRERSDCGWFGSFGRKRRPHDNYEFLTNSSVSFAIINSSFVGIM